MMDNEFFSAELLREFAKVDARCDAFIAKQRAAQAEAEPLVYKTCDNIGGRGHQSSRDQSQLTNDEAWNDWLDARAADLIAEYDKLAVEAHNTLVEDLQRELDAAFDEIEQLKTELGALRADMNVVQAITRGEVASLKAKTDADAA